MKNLIKTKRQERKLKIRELAQMLNIDQALISKFESGQRLPTRQQIIEIARYLEIDQSELLAQWLKEKLMREMSDYSVVSRTLELVREEQQSYSKKREVKSFDSDLRAINDLKAQLDSLREFDSYRIAQALELEYTFESNRIEGNTLTLKETDLVVNQGLTISGKSMREHLEAINHQEAIDYIKDLVRRKVRLSERELLNLHNLILRGIIPEYAGKYRDVQVMISGSKHLPPNPLKVKEEMEGLFVWYRTHAHILHPVILAAEFHQRLVTIHPFVDGNGRVSRLLMNLILLQHGFVIANIKGDHAVRMSYYACLEKSQTDTSSSDFIQFILDVEKECLSRYLSVLS
jgi:Fic family protein/DNA-binding XRE family transcriptional regulator